MPHLKAHNDVNLGRHNVYHILDYLSELLFDTFRRRVSLVVHGGIVMVLHERLACRDDTRDIDFCLRSFVPEYTKLGYPDAEARLNSCISHTAKKFGLGADWMNSHADVALPMAFDKHGRPFDPIYHDATAPDNKRINTIYKSRGLTLIGVSWSWAVALKLVRFQKHDPMDIARILTLGYHQKGVSWTRTLLEGWLRTMCPAMNYDMYPPQRMDKTRANMREAIRLIPQVLLKPELSAPPPPIVLPPTRSVQPAPSHHQASAVSKHQVQPYYVHVHAPPPLPPPMPAVRSARPAIYAPAPPQKHSPVFVVSPPSSVHNPTAEQSGSRRRYNVRPPTPYHSNTQTLPPIYLGPSQPVLKAF